MPNLIPFPDPHLSAPSYPRDCESNSPPAQALETNGPANIIMHLDLVALGHCKLDLELVRRSAALTVLYLRAIHIQVPASLSCPRPDEAGLDIPRWHEILEAWHDVKTEDLLK